MIMDAQSNWKNEIGYGFIVEWLEEEESSLFEMFFFVGIRFQS